MFGAYILSGNFFLKHAIEESLEETRRRGITSKQLMYDLKEKEDTGKT